MMPEEDDAETRRIRQALGKCVNPLYVRTLLEKPTIDLLIWLQDNFADSVRTAAETVAVAERSGSPPRSGTYDLGLRILAGRLDLMSFVLAEITARNTAIDTSTPTDV